MARSLARNTRVYASTLTKTALEAGSASPADTFEVKVLDGYSFSQDTTNQEVNVNEAGTTPVRGSRAFNTALNPADVTFSTYVRSFINADTYGDSGEKILWASTMGTATGFTNSATAGSETPANTYARTNSAGTEDIIFNLTTSNSNELLDLTLVFNLDNTTYVIEDFNVSTAEVDFSIDGIATINWGGQGSIVTESQNMHTEVATWTGGAEFTAMPATTAATFIRNKLSTLVLTDHSETPAQAQDAIDTGGITGQVITMTSVAALTASEFIGGRIKNSTVSPDEWATIVANTTDTVTVSDADDITGWSDADVVDLYTNIEHAGVNYNIPITGATLSLENNFTYLTPEELAIVNLPLAGFSGNRITSGTFTAYLNTGAPGSAGLLQDLLEKTNEVSNNFSLTFQMGGTTTTNPRVYFIIPYAQIGIPTTGVEDLLTTEITFTAQPWDTGNSVASFEDTNEITIQYLPAT